jgi:hypothetical protein
MQIQKTVEFRRQRSSPVFRTACYGDPTQVAHAVSPLAQDLISALAKSA